MYDVDQLITAPELLSPLRRSLQTGEAPPFLRSAKIKLTARCNLKCSMCRYGRGLSLPELSPARMLEVLDELAGAGCRKVHFSGGEVLIRKDFEELVARASSAGMKVTLTSNLTLLSKDRAKALMKEKISSLSTSLDGASPKVHDGIRGIEGSFKRTLRALEHVQRFRRNERPRVRVNFVMMRANFRDYPEVVRIAAERGATDVVPMPVDTKSPQVRLSKTLIREYDAEVAPRVAEARAAAGMSLEETRVFPFGRSKEAVALAAEGNYASGYYEQHRCYAPWLHLFIAWDGKVYLCCMTNGRIEPLGDLAEQSVSEIFAGERFQRVRARMKEERLPACHQCDMYLTENRRLEAALAER